MVDQRARTASLSLKFLSYFKPGVKFHQLRRYYTDKIFKDEMSKRVMPVLVRNLDGTQPFAPSRNAIICLHCANFFLRVAEFYVKKIYKHQKLWTYIQETEDGRYISEAGYHIDHYVKSRGPRHVPMLRFAKELFANDGRFIFHRRFLFLKRDQSKRHLGDVFIW